MKQMLIDNWLWQKKSISHHLINQLQTNFPKLYQVLNFDDSSLWSNFSRSNECEREFPSVVEKRITLFQQLLVVQAVRPDRLQTAMGLFACKALGLCLYWRHSYLEKREGGIIGKIF